MRKRLARRSGSFKYRAARWSSRHRPVLIVTGAFIAATLLGVVVFMGGLQSLSDGLTSDAPPVAAAQ